MGLRPITEKIHQEPVLLLLPDDHPANQLDEGINSQVNQIWNDWIKTEQGKNDHDAMRVRVVDQKKVAGRLIFFLAKIPYRYFHVYQKNLEAEAEPLVEHIELVSSNGILTSNKHLILGEGRKLSTFGGFLDIKEKKIEGIDCSMPPGVLEKNEQGEYQVNDLELEKYVKDLEETGKLESPLRNSVLREGLEEAGISGKTNGPYCRIKLVNDEDEEQVFENWIGYEIEPKRSLPFLALPRIVAQHRIYNARQLIRGGEREISGLVALQSLEDLHGLLNEGRPTRRNVEPMVEALFDKGSFPRVRLPRIVPRLTIMERSPKERNIQRDR